MRMDMINVIGQDRSSAEIYICAGTTISFDKPLYMYSNSVLPPQPPFDLKLLCCDCNCVLDAAAVHLEQITILQLPLAMNGD
mmetsp:Transcript_18213/g.25908  ORF Transcript_18213/g.25908 Transcript_18213/m.25908 type:complete len:82 (+) Transcript_18213:40-285(+)